MSGWEAIRDDMRARIAAREWVPGGLIPGEQALAVSYGVARATVNRAMRELAGSGLVERRRKAGTRVAQGAARRALLSIPVIREQVEALGLPHAFQILTLREQDAPDQVRGDMALAEGTVLLHVVTLHRAGDVLDCVLTDPDSEPFDVTAAPDADVHASAEQRRPGGLGLHLVRRLVDSMEYDYSGRRSRISLHKTLGNG